MRSVNSMFTQDQGGFQSTDDRDAPMSEIYYIGIIDILQNYNFKKKVEHSFKSITQNKEGLSAVGAGQYAKRFYNFIAERTGVMGPIKDLRKELGLIKKEKKDEKNEKK